MDDPGPINCDLVRVYLKKIKPYNYKAEGPDAVYARILKECERERDITSIGYNIFQIYEGHKNST